MKIELYYADWCLHCINFMPVWNELKGDLKKMEIDVKEYSDENRQKLAENGVHGFPTIRISEGDKLFTYRGGRTLDEIIDTLDSLKNGNVLDNLEETYLPKKEETQTGGSPMKNSTQIKLYHAEWCHYCREFMPEWKKLKQDNDSKKTLFFEYKWEKPDGGDVMKKENITSYPTIRFSVNGKTYEYEGERSQDMLKKAIDMINSENIDERFTLVEMANSGEYNKSNKSNKSNGSKPPMISQSGGKAEEYYRSKYIFYKQRYLELKEKIPK